MSWKTVVGDIYQMGKSFGGALGVPFVVSEVAHAKGAHKILASGKSWKEQKPGKGNLGK